MLLDGSMCTRHADAGLPRATATSVRQRRPRRRPRPERQRSWHRHARRNAIGPSETEHIKDDRHRRTCSTCSRVQQEPHRLCANCLPEQQTEERQHGEPVPGHRRPLRRRYANEGDESLDLGRDATRRQRRVHARERSVLPRRHADTHRDGFFDMLLAREYGIHLRVDAVGGESARTEWRRDPDAVLHRQHAERRIHRDGRCD